VKSRDRIFVGFGIILALTFISLGFWQLARLAERRTLNDSLRSRAETAPIAFADLPKDSSAARFTRVKVDGTYDFAHEIVLTNRTRNGSPGVHIITPLRMPGSDTLVLVNRGWVYAPDGMTAVLTRWREAESVTGDGFVQNLTTRAGQARSARRPNAYRWMDRPTLSQAFPYPIAGYYIVLIGDGKPQVANVPPRLEVPPLDEGSHLNYSFQWFSFAAISIIGMFLFVRRK